MISYRAAYGPPTALRTGRPPVIGTGRILRDGVTAQCAAALGPEPARTSGLVAA